MNSIELIEYLYSRGLTNSKIEALLKSTLSEINNHKINSLFDEFFDSVSISILNRFEYLDFDFSAPSKFIEIDIFSPVEKWYSTGNHFKKLSELNDADSSLLSAKGVTIREYSSRTIPDIVKIINNLEFSESFDLGLNSYDYFMEGNHDEWQFFASKKEIVFYTDTTNWVLLKKDVCFFSKNGKCYKISKSHLMGGASKSQLDMYENYLQSIEIEHLKTLNKNDYVSSYKTVNLIGSYLFDYTYHINENSPPMNRVSIKKNIESADVYGVILDVNTGNFQLFIKPKCICDDSEVYISSLGYIENTLSYIGMGILFDGFDSVDNAFDFEQKSIYALEHQIKNFSKFCVFKEYIVTKDKNIPTKFGSYSPEHIPFGISVRPYRNQDRDYIESLLKDELYLVINNNLKKTINDRSINLVSERDFSKLISYI